MAKIPVFPVHQSMKHMPLALGMIQAYACEYENGRLLDAYTFYPVMNQGTENAVRMGKAFGPGIWLFSNYIWTLDLHLEISRQVKAQDPRNITIHGGPNTPQHPQASLDFLIRHSHVDFIVRGEGEKTVSELMSLIATRWDGKKEGDKNRPDSSFKTVKGITYLDRSVTHDPLIRTQDRPVLENLNELPSPYLNDICKKTKHIKIAALETTRGCPFKCAFCDWGHKNGRVRSFDLKRVAEEIKCIGRKEIPVLYITDANFGLLDRDVKIATHVAAAKRKYGFPKEVMVSFSLNQPGRVVEIVKHLYEAGILCQGIASIQTMDRRTLAVMNRKGDPKSNLLEMADAFRKGRLPLSVDLILGLPGATIDTLKTDLQILFDLDLDVKIYRAMLLPNSPMAEPDFMGTHKIEADHANLLVSTVSYSEQDLVEMMGINELYTCFDRQSVLRLVLRYLQWDHGIQGLAFIHCLYDALTRHPEKFASMATDDSVGVRFRLGDGWDPIFKDIKRFIFREYGLKDDVCLWEVMALNQRILPDRERLLPESMVVRHDFVRYFRDHIEGKRHKLLSSYPEGKITITDPMGLCNRFRGPLAHRLFNSYQMFGELETPLRRMRSAIYTYD